MRTVITGGAGFLGQKLAHALLAEGHRVRLLTRGKDPGIPGAEPMAGDLADPASLVRAFDGCDAVFHTAGLVSYNPEKDALMHATNVMGTRNAVDAARRAGVGRFVHTSSTAAIGINYDPDRLMDETSPFNAQSLGMAYFTTKWEAEEEVRKGVAAGLDAVILNPGSLLGAGDTRRYEQAYPGLIYRFHPRLLVHGGICFVDVNDAVAGHLLAWKKGRTGERYILGGENLSFADLIRRTNAIIGRESPRAYLPLSLMGVAASAIRILQKCGLHLHITPELVKQVCTWYLYVDSGKARRELGWRPQPIDRAIRETLDWLKGIGRIH
ncbi:MAG: NAD-dependent epimerase/dehydratase family protein [Bdellovibrionales bacterium]|nr:NAD-dependent epimerase/dehydratase family protein [Bdellovibrionales bacterium]